MTIAPRQIGTKLKAIREAKGMSQGALAQKAKITREYVNRLEAGRYDPTIGVLQRLAKALGVPVTALLE
jgi:putative transcriptional regulator